MFTISQVTDLPFQEADVAAHFGFDDGVTVANLRPQSISPGGEFCAGACMFTPVKPEGQLPMVRGFILKNTTPTAAVPTWTVVPNFKKIPSEWKGFSIRGVNDRGDITGFFFVTPEEGGGSGQPYVKFSGQDFVELKVPPLTPVTHGTVWDINNDREIGGEYREKNKAQGFMAKLREDGSIDPADYTEPPVDRVKSFNDKKDVLGTRREKADFHFFVYGSGPIAGQAINITQQTVFVSFPIVRMNGLNNSRQIAGFFGREETQNKGFLGQFDDNGVLDPFVWSHPSSLTDTRLFSISNDGIVVGVKGMKNPFFLIAKS
jgi:hypothetical protein